MATIHFYEKPGCGNNTKQKKLLTEAGHTLIVHDLLRQDWRGQPEKLRSFFGDKPVVEWFNRAAPIIKHGLLDPADVNATQAIDMMIAEPLLIRRPLIEIENRCMAGFETGEVERFLGLETSENDLESCPIQHSAKACRHE